MQQATLTWRTLLADATARLGAAHEARRLVERASGFEGSDYALGLGEAVPARTQAFFESMLERRAAGEPLQYVIGRWGFRRLDLFVDRRVLIPRPETESVVGVALAELDQMGPRPNVVDLGTGSGAIALSIAVEASTAKVLATDQSAEALEVAALNLTGIGTLAAPRVRLAQGSWFRAVPATMRGAFQLIVSNPPYVAGGEPLPDVVSEWEPAAALRSGPTGTEDIAQIVSEAPKWLARPGALVVELAPHQAGAAVEMARAAGFASPEIRRDLSGRDRVLVARIPR